MIQNYIFHSCAFGRGVKDIERVVAEVIRMSTCATKEDKRVPIPYKLGEVRKTNTQTD